MPETHLTDLSFSKLDLNPRLLAGLEEAGFEWCTPVQARTLPLALEGHDVAGQAQTGTGKTAAFLLAALNHLLARPADANRRVGDPRTVVLAPTRELAVQIFNDAEILAQGTGFSIGVVYGGADYEKQRNMLTRGLDILIGTPGRLIDYFKQGIFDFRAVQVLVLDEADRMFDLGFIRDIRYVLRRMPPPAGRLNMLFSATLSHRVMELAYEHMNDPQLVQIEPDKVTADRVRQLIYFPSNQEKIPLLIGLLKTMEATRTLVFVNTKREAERLQAFLDGNGIHALAISGDVPQRKRLSMLRQFQTGELPVLIGTDVASRGLHIPDVSHVINYDLPQDAEDYVHRIGRTARAGAAGDAISFGCENYVMSLPEIEDYIGHKIPVGTVEPELLAEVARPTMRPRRPKSAKRPSGGGSSKPKQRQRHGRRRRNGS